MEKRFNKNDPTAPKDVNNYQGMIPGIHNIQSIGSKPTLRRANDDMPDPSSYNSLPSKQLNRSFKDLKNAVKPLEDFTKIESPTGNEKYNPITNPVPFFNQNPYISKEKSIIGGDGAGTLLSSNRRSRRSLLSSIAEKNM